MEDLRSQKLKRMEYAVPREECAQVCNAAFRDREDDLFCGYLERPALKDPDKPWCNWDKEEWRYAVAERSQRGR